MTSPVVYAEDTLGVHKIWHEAQSASKAFQVALSMETVCAKKIREIKDNIADREHQLVSETRPAFHELSETAFGRKIKELLKDDPSTKQLQQDLRNAEHEQDEAQSSVRYWNTETTLLAARLNELGGLLNFYAACKIEKAKA